MRAFVPHDGERSPSCGTNRLMTTSQSGWPGNGRTARRTRAVGREERVRGSAASGVAAQARLRAGFESVPMPSIVMSTVCPSVKPPRPAGVPVQMTSPGSRVHTLEANSMISGTV